MKYIFLVTLLTLTACMPYTQIDLEHSADTNNTSEDGKVAETEDIFRDLDTFGGFFIPETDSLSVNKDDFKERLAINGKRMVHRDYDKGISITYYWQYRIADDIPAHVRLVMRPAYIRDTAIRFSDAIIKGFRGNQTQITEPRYDCVYSTCYHLEDIAIIYTEEMSSHDNDVFEIRLYSSVSHYTFSIPFETLPDFLSEIETLLPESHGLITP